MFTQGERASIKAHEIERCTAALDSIEEPDGGFEFTHSFVELAERYAAALQKNKNDDTTTRGAADARGPKAATDQEQKSDLQKSLDAVEQHLEAAEVVGVVSAATGRDLENGVARLGALLKLAQDKVRSAEETWDTGWPCGS